MIIVAMVVFHENNKYYTQVFLVVYINYKCYILIELTFLEELMLIGQVNQKVATFVTIDVFQIKGLSFNRTSATSVTIY